MSIVYLAASSKELPRARRAMDWITEAKHTVALDWVQQILAMGGKDPNRGIPPNIARTIALNAFSHLRRSNVIWLLSPETETEGAWIEFGAYAFHVSTLIGPKLIMSGGDPETSVFLNGLLTHHFVDDEAAIRWLETQR